MGKTPGHVVIPSDFETLLRRNNLPREDPMETLARLDDYDPNTRCRDAFRASRSRGPCRLVCHCIDVVLDHLASELSGIKVVGSMSTTPVRDTAIFMPADHPGHDWDESDFDEDGYLYGD